MSFDDRHSSDLELPSSDYDDNIAKDLSDARLAKKQIEYKYQLLKERYEEELTTFSHAKVADIFKNSGAKEYIETLNKRIRVKDELVKKLQQETENLNKEVDSLRERCKLSEKRTDHYYQAWRDSEAKNDRLLEMSNREHSISHERMLSDTSPALSFDTGHAVPSPPPIAMPSIDEILKSVRSPPVNEQQMSFASTNNSQYTNFDQMNGPIPPPPPMNVSINDILGQLSSPHGSVYSNGRRN